MTSTYVDHRCTAKHCAHRDAYVLESHCMNCGWNGEVAVTVGHEASGSMAKCPQCECRRLHNGNFVRRVAA